MSIHSGTVHSGAVHSSVDDSGVAKIVFAHPRGNSLPGVLLADLAKSIRLVSGDTRCKVLLIQSEGQGAFCAGASFEELCSLTTPGAATEFFMGFGEVMLALMECPVFTVARVHGKVVGGGVGLVSACDYVIASSIAAARLSELSIGIGPSVIGPVVRRKIGLAHFSTMAIGGEWHDANWCRSTGLYSELVEGSASDLNAAVLSFLGRLTSSSGIAMSAIKKSLQESAAISREKLRENASVSAQLLLTPACQAALEAIGKI